MSLDLIRMLEVIYFNPALIDSLGLENPYDLVNDHKWTLDKMTEMAAAALSDLRLRPPVRTRPARLRRNEDRDTDLRRRV